MLGRSRKQTRGGLLRRLRHIRRVRLDTRCAVAMFKFTYQRPHINHGHIERQQLQDPLKIHGSALMPCRPAAGRKRQRAFAG